MANSGLDSEFGSSLLAGLDEIGIGGTGPPKKSTKTEQNKVDDKKTSVNKTQNKTKPKESSTKAKDVINTSAPKRRPPRAPRINLTDFTNILPSPVPLSNINKSSNEHFNVQQTNQYQVPNSNFNNYHTPPNQLTQIENRLTSYLQSSLKQLANEFISTLPTLFNDVDIVSPASTALINQLQDDIRRLIDFQVSEQITYSNSYNPLTQVFDSYAPLFKDLYYDAEKAKGKNYTEKTKLIKEARNTANASTTLMQTQVSELVEEFTSIANELNFSRMTERNKKRHYAKQIKSIRDQLNYLESKKIELKGKEKSLKKQIKAFEAEQDNYSNSNEIDVDEFRSLMRSSLDTLRTDITVVQNPDVMHDMQKSSYQLDSLCEEVDAMRQMKLFQTQNFADVTYIPAVTFTYNTMRPQLPNESFNQDDGDESTLSFESSALTPSPSNELRRKFHNITRKRKDQLQNVTDFMDSVRRGEKRRSRKRVTDVSLLSEA